jgi:hypothetical protein
LKIDNVKDKKTMHKNVIGQFKKYYPDDLTAIKDLQIDYTIFMRTWDQLSDKRKGHRIKNGEVVKFFLQIGTEKAPLLSKTIAVDEAEDQNDKFQKSLK